MKYSVYSDGAARGNPGAAGAGFVVFDENGKEVHRSYEALGSTTNNIAEYAALLNAVKYIKSIKPNAVDFYLDSELIVKQISGEYKVKAEHLKPYYTQVITLLAGLNATCRHVPRAQNKVADQLANLGADESEKK